MKLTEDDFRELGYLARRGPTYPGAKPGKDEQLDKLAELGLATYSVGLWAITPAGRAALKEKRT